MRSKTTTSIPRLLALVLAVLVLGGCKPAEMPPQKLPAGPTPEAQAECPWRFNPGPVFRNLPAQPAALALSPAGDELFIAGAGGVQVLDSATGAPRRKLEMPEPATAVAVAPDRAVFAAGAAGVRFFPAAGSPAAVWTPTARDRAGGPPPLRLITGLAATDAELFVADAGSRLVFRFARDGDYIDEIGREDAVRQIPGLRLPSPFLDVALAGPDLLAVNNPGMRRLELYDFSGSLKSFFGAPGTGLGEFSGCCNPTNVAAAATADGSVLAAAEKGMPRIQVFTVAGKILAYIDPKHFAPQAAGIDLAVAPGATRIYALDPAAAAVFVFEKQD